MTWVLILATARPGWADSAAAIIVISAPVIAKNTIGTVARTAIQPCAAKPPCAVRLSKVGPFGAIHPKAYEAAIVMNTKMAATLIEANQNSNSAYERADMRFTAVITAISPTPICSGDSGIHCCRILAPAIASTGTTSTQKYQ